MCPRLLDHYNVVVNISHKSLDFNLDYYAKLMVNENYTNKKIMAISGAGPSAIIR
jgi:hypothetical protein